LAWGAALAERFDPPDVFLGIKPTPSLVDLGVLRRDLSLFGEPALVFNPHQSDALSQQHYPTHHAACQQHELVRRRKPRQ
jgi:hypothetical protein